MILKLSEFTKKVSTEYKFYLLYGQNTGLIEETINNILKPQLSKNIYNYDENEVTAKIDQFLENILNKSFFENDKLFIINRVSDKILNLIREISEKEDKNLQIILKAENLDKKSKLRNFFERKKNLIIVPFYEETNQSLTLLAKNFFKKNNISISWQNINFIVEKSKGNRINLNNELNKINNFNKNNLPIKFSDILKLSSSAEDYAISKLVDRCLLKNKKEIINILNENNHSFEDNILIIRSFLFKLKRLKNLKMQIEKNKNQDQVISSYKPQIFWKDKEIIKKQLNVLSKNDLKNYIKKINNLELLIKKNLLLSDKITNNFVLEAVVSPNS